MLNGVLPRTIRIISWQPVSPSFNARFSCTSRTYRYFFHADQLDLVRMQVAADELVGSHDFRNFCKIDPTMSTHFTRHIQSVQVRACQQVPEDCVQLTAPWPCDQTQWIEDARNSMGGAEADPTAASSSSASASASTSSSSSSTPAPAAALPTLHPDTFCELVIHGNAFLYHQVRCMAAVLFLVGRGAEAPEVVRKMLDVSATGTGTGKPSYDMAPELPLVLYDTGFPSLPVTPGFDFQTRPASRPLQHTTLGETDAAAAAAAAAAHATTTTTTTTNGVLTAAAASSPATEAAAAATSSAASSFSFSSSASASSHPLPNLYPSASACLRNSELVFAHFHLLWREYSMVGKVHELFVNQCARNLQAVRNACGPGQLGGLALDMPRLNAAHAGGPKGAQGQRMRAPVQPQYCPPPTPRTLAPLLPATLGCRGHGLRCMPYVAHGPHTSILHRPVESSYETKCLQLKGKKLQRHQSVKEMSDKFKKPNATYRVGATKTTTATAAAAAPVDGDSEAAASTVATSAPTSLAAASTASPASTLLLQPPTASSTPAIPTAAAAAAADDQHPMEQ